MPYLKLCVFATSQRCKFSHTHTLTHSLTLSLSHTHTLTHTHTPHTHTHTHPLTHSLTHSHTRARAHTHTHTCTILLHATATVQDFDLIMPGESGSNAKTSPQFSRTLGRIERLLDMGMTSFYFDSFDCRGRHQYVGPSLFATSEARGREQWV